MRKGECEEARLFAEGSARKARRVRKGVCREGRKSLKKGG